MDTNEIITLVNNVGFPIASVIGLSYYLYKLHLEDREDRKANAKILNSFANNIKENTNLLQQILDIIKGKKDE